MWLRVVFVAGALTAGDVAAQETVIERGQYLVHAGGCVSCHTADEDDAVPFAGGAALESPFGIFFSPNITPDQETGIGNWSDESFLNAFWNGVSPQGSHYFPAFPYTAYTGLAKDDILAIKAYLFSLEPIHQENKAHQLPFYLSTRLAAGVWKWLYFTPGRFEPDATQDSEWNRGAYLVRHLGHCGECHTPRNSLGKLLNDKELAGTSSGPEGEKTPDITPDRDDGIGRWSSSEIELFLEIGMQPGGDFAGGKMVSVIDDNTSQLRSEDRNAISVYLKSVPPSGSLRQ